MFFNVGGSLLSLHHSHNYIASPKLVNSNQIKVHPLLVWCGWYDYVLCILLWMLPEPWLCCLYSFNSFFNVSYKVFLHFLTLAHSWLAGKRVFSMSTLLPWFLRVTVCSLLFPLLRFLCVRVSLTLHPFLWGCDVGVHLVCWVLCRFEFAHLAS